MILKTCTSKLVNKHRKKLSNILFKNKLNIGSFNKNNDFSIIKEEEKLQDNEGVYTLVY